MAKIIMADDDEIVCEIVSDALRAHGHAVGFVGNGEDALRVISARQPDLVILDCNMPRLPGMLTLRAMRNSLELWDTPVLMLTGLTSEQDKTLAQYEGANEYMTKPFDPEELVFKVEHLLAARTQRKEAVRTARRPV
jgi:DNA-binding response OmpR family regulator